MTEPMDREDDLELVDPGSKTQPAEGGREEVEESLAATRSLAMSGEDAGGDVDGEDGAAG